VQPTEVGVRRERVVRRVLFGSAAVLLLVVVGVSTLFSAVAPDDEAPAEVQRILPEARHHLVTQLDLYTSIVRYVGWEHRPADDLVILKFEVRQFPFIFVDRAYLGSRCVPIADLDPLLMDGGVGILDFATDPELEFLRSDAQPACP
jgi:hypothetical protein